MSTRILIMEDDPSGRELAVFNLKKAGYDVQSAADGDEGMATLAADTFDLVVTDVKMPGMSGIDVLKQIKKNHPALPVIIITAFANVELAVEAMKLGAEDFLGKPFSRDHLLLVVEKALRHRELTSEITRLRARAGGVERPILFHSEKMAKTVETTDRFAASEASVLISGESGTGKELIARRIHARSQRANGPFVAVNLAAMPENLIESELFGHQKGAFTGATSNRQGRFRQAHGGTIFLDEIAELPLALQGKLLRVLQEKTVDPLGSDAPEKVDVRVVAATNRHLTHEVAEGRFREDLYYRINVVDIPVPALRERRDDIPMLVRHFISVFSMGRTLEIPDPVMDIMCRHPWSGNIRELENICQRLVLLAREETVQIDDLPPAMTGTNCETHGDTLADKITFPADGVSLLDIEKAIIEKALRLQSGNVSQTAAFLKIPRHVLAYRMEKFGIQK
ncbi:MAG: sigma-54-dependent Fis family transcriptional regulator [Deltaproteobacteria bacterium]|nr:sigma-54-dependent Fis family transcriptional regulator [Deltaproteobacteria bacterium]